MQRFEGVIYDEKPKDVTVYQSCVDVVQRCEEFEIEDEASGETFQKYKCDVERYTTTEYIGMMQEASNELRQQATLAQIGIVEVYEMLLGMM